MKFNAKKWFFKSSISLLIHITPFAKSLVLKYGFSDHIWWHLCICSHVIMVLADVAHGKHRHVPYRDSRLTFLLQVRNIWVILFCSHSFSLNISKSMSVTISGFFGWQLQNYDNCKCQPFDMVYDCLAKLFSSLMFAIFDVVH